MHESGCFVLPNPWDIGTAIYLEHLGFEALATTSAGFAFSRGKPDGGVPRDEMLAHVREIVEATALPVNADFMAGYADYPTNMNATSILEGNRKSETGAGHVLWEQNATLNGHPGKRIAVTDGTRAWVSEFYGAGNRGYAARYTTRNLLRAALDAAPFLGSLQIAQ